jgi:hypothetical protein
MHLRAVHRRIQTLLTETLQAQRIKIDAIRARDQWLVGVSEARLILLEN